MIDIKHFVQEGSEELEITIEKGFFNMYEFARQNKIMVEEKQIKFYIACLHKD